MRGKIKSDLKENNRRAHLNNIRFFATCRQFSNGLILLLMWVHRLFVKLRQFVRNNHADIFFEAQFQNKKDYFKTRLPFQRF